MKRTPGSRPTPSLATAAFACAAVALTAHGAATVHGQDLATHSEPSATRSIALLTEDCGARWATHVRLAPLLRVELRGAEGTGPTHTTIEIVSATEEHQAWLRVETTPCNPMADGARLSAGLGLSASVGPGPALVERQVSLEDTDPSARARTLSLALFDLWQAASHLHAQTSAVAPVEQPAVEGDAASETAPSPREPSAAARLSAPANGVGSSEAGARPGEPEATGPRIIMDLAFEASIFPSTKTPFPGGHLSAYVEWPKLSFVRIGGGLGKLAASAEDALGQVTLLVYQATLGVEAHWEHDSVELGFGIELRPAWIRASGGSTADGVTARTDDAFALDLAALVRLRWAFAAPFGLRIDVGVGQALGGLDGLADDRTVLSYGGLMVLTRAGLSLAL